MLVHTSEAPVGSGLGASSVLSVACIKAYAEFFNLRISRDKIAKLAFISERKNLGLVGGLQDHYAASFGGINHVIYKKNGDVNVTRIKLNSSIKMELQVSLLLIYSGRSRKSSSIIQKQVELLKSKEKYTIDLLHQLKEFVLPMKSALLKGEIEEFGKLIGLSWKLKKELSKDISNPQIDSFYDQAIKAGAYGGKLMGAGGGGFLLFIVPPERRQKIVNKILGREHFVLETQINEDGVHSWHR